MRFGASRQAGGVASGSDKTDLSPGERRAVGKLVDSIKRQGRQTK